MAPFNTQMQQENAKYKKDANKVGLWPALRKVLKESMFKPQRLIDVLIRVDSANGQARIVPTLPTHEAGANGLTWCKLVHDLALPCPVSRGRDKGGAAAMVLA
ncbi:MAG: hypothetical protein HY019_14150 [Aquabacterium sp.]|uniref:hypothetical protein n=1 Tax=Aquabacterium sp. TaxID=1872578 RepID=UPI0025C6E5E6|nr:hypothetical protein [Aquabacterium sp.]MBI3383143.1 hypothetical protein [Aquabacterium sp.]